MNGGTAMLDSHPSAYCNTASAINLNEKFLLIGDLKETTKDLQLC